MDSYETSGKKRLGHYCGAVLAATTYLGRYLGRRDASLLSTPSPVAAPSTVCQQATRQPTPTIKVFSLLPLPREATNLHDEFRRALRLLNPTKAFQPRDCISKYPHTTGASSRFLNAFLQGPNHCTFSEGATASLIRSLSPQSWNRRARPGLTQTQAINSTASS